MHKPIDQVIAQFSRMVAPDGGRVELIDMSDGIVSVRYSRGTNARCASCVLTPEDLGELLKEALVQHHTDVRSVSVISD